jgi:transposase
MAEEPYHREEWLREQYIEERRTTVDIAEECGVSATTITTWMDKHGIDRRSRSEAQIDEKKKVHNEEWLCEQYLEEKRSMRDIGKEVGMTPSGVKKWINKFNIETRSSTDHYRHQPASYFTAGNGYEKVSAKHNYESSTAMVHQLVMIAEGANPAKVFSNGRYHIHHKNGVYWDNRPENLELKAAKVHGSDHNAPESTLVPSGYATELDKDELLVEVRNLIAEWRQQDNPTLDMAADELHNLLKES